jgi:hypothetical protein
VLKVVKVAQVNKTLEGCIVWYKTLSLFMIKEIKGYESIYTINDKGEVYSVPRKGTKGGIIKQHITECGYLYVMLCKNMVTKRKTIHRLISEAFIENENQKPQVNHIDGNKLNNKISNLEWCTVSENQIHAYKIGLSVPRSGHRNGKAKLEKHQVIEIRDYVISKGRYYGRKELAKKYKVSESTIKDIVNKVSYVY